MTKKLLQSLPFLAVACVVSCAGPSSPDRFTYVDMEKLPPSTALEFYDHAAFEIRLEKGGYALVDLHQPRSRYGVMYLEKYPLNTLQPGEAAAVRQLMEKSLHSRQVDKWLIVQMRSYTGNMVGIYQRNDDRMDLTKRPRGYGWENPNRPNSSEPVMKSPAGNILPPL